MDQSIVLDLDEQGFVGAHEPGSVHRRRADELEMKRRTDESFSQDLDRSFEARLVVRDRVIRPDLVPEQPEVGLSEPLDRLELNGDRHFDDRRVVELGEISGSVSHGATIVRRVRQSERQPRSRTGRPHSPSPIIADSARQRRSGVDGPMLTVPTESASDTAPESLWLRVPAGTSAADLRALGSVAPARPSPLIAKMAANLKFAQCLPPSLSASTARTRLADPRAVERCLSEPVMNWRV
jgi:hypothetical protein